MGKHAAWGMRELLLCVGLVILSVWVYCSNSIMNVNLMAAVAH